MSRVLCVVAFAFVCIALGCFAQESSPQCGGASDDGGPCVLAPNDAEKNNYNKREARKAYTKAKAKTAVVADFAGKAVTMCEDVKGYLESFAPILGSIIYYANEAHKLLLKHPESDELTSVSVNAERATQQTANLRDSVQIKKQDICNYSEELYAKYLEVNAAVDDIGNTIYNSNADFADDELEQVKQKSKQIVTTVARIVVGGAANKQQLHRAMQTAENAKDAAEELRKETEEALLHARAKAKRMQRQKLFEERHRRPTYQ